ncbi:hypothetical protein [Paractinoplanes brasiliensis]|uniref:Uncharacterized protein n=1 Tax=Paractinoplanes brasiliensis TaxID=52695 RepID=A0A4R6JAR9_9ACTN|nr:hypothetical protein [Actinoplanes brasiliensis]TDO32800.1 hypothetical protein C8E87_8272 [Actinoplanes brasiliensis]GID31655.1 hypothetical protein Abr02nite_66380 [Actinoplanes brasiliensis]
MNMLPYASAWPPEWTGRRRSRRLLFGVFYLGALAALSATAAGWQLLYDDAGQALFFAGLAVFLGHLAGLCVSAYRSGQRRADTAGVRRTAAGLIFPYAPGATYLVTATLAMTTLAAGGYAIVAGLRGDWLVAGLFGVVALPLLAYLVVVLRLVPAELVIGPDGVHHRGLTFTHFIPWIALTSARPAWDGGPVIAVGYVGSADTRSRDYLGRPMSAPEMVNGRWLAADPGLALTALQHYIAHPEHRWELTTDAALPRITAR